MVDPSLIISTMNSEEKFKRKIMHFHYDLYGLALAQKPHLQCDHNSIVQRLYTTQIYMHLLKKPSNMGKGKTPSFVYLQQIFSSLNKTSPPSPVT